jgi:hypothetical protein
MRALGLTGLLLFSSSVALAAPPPPPSDRPGIDLGARGGYAIPFGDIDADRGSLAGWASSAAPVIIEAGYRFDRHFSLGPYFQFGFAQVKNGTNTGCSDGSDCTGWIVRAGLQLLYHFDAGSVIAPWLGVGTGYEWTSYSGAVGSVGFSGNASGWEFLNLQLGGDFLLGQGVTLGPFVCFSLARYGRVSGGLGNLTASSDVTNPAVHEWLLFGARFTFGL